MCGICGFIERNTKYSAGREQFLELMMAALIHRGPDQGKSWLSEKAALGLRRLSIIDLEGSVQPMANETGELVLVFNGEIYNYRELRAELIRAGHHFSTQGDSEVLLHGYEEWGQELPRHLRGMFAFAIWDEKKEQLYAARDPFGIKPFYYALTDGCFLFASEIKGILPHPSYKKRLNTEALEQYLSFQYSALEKTFFQGIWQLKPGHFLKYEKKHSSLELEQYFVPELCPESPFRLAKKKQEEAWIHRLDQVIEDSVKTHMAADVEVGSFLSGGVDSSLVAAEFTGTKTFTVGFGKEQTRYNEMPLAKELAGELGLWHRGKQISEKEFWEAVPEVLYHMDEPSGDPSAVALYFLSREAARQVKVVVSGEGADELFGGYCIYCEPNALRLYQKIPSPFRKGIASLAARLPLMRGRSFLIRGSMPVEERFIGNANLFTARDRKKLLKCPTRALSPQEFLADDYKDAEKLDQASRMQYIDLLHWLPGDILQKADRMSMAHSLEVRVPFLDKEVFALTRRLPAHMKQRGRITKYILRKAAASKLDTATSERPKLGFPVPIRHWICEEEGQTRLRKAFTSPAAHLYFHQEKLMELLEEHLKKHKDNSRKLWTIYTFCTWYSIYFNE